MNEYDKKKKDDQKKNFAKRLSEIKRKAKYDDEGDEAFGDFTYDMMFSTDKDSYKNMYSDYRD